MRNSTKLPRINNIRCLESWWNWQKTNRRNCLTNRCKAIYKTHQFITCKLDKQDAECRPQLRQCHRMKCCAPTPTYVYINIYLKCYIYAFSSCVWRRNCASSKHKVVIHILNNKKSASASTEHKNALKLLLIFRSARTSHFMHRKIHKVQNVQIFVSESKKDRKKKWNKLKDKHFFGWPFGLCLLVANICCCRCCSGWCKHVTQRHKRSTWTEPKAKQ